MNTKSLRQILKRSVCSVLVWLLLALLPFATRAADPTAAGAPALRTGHSLAQIVKLLHAKVGEDTIIAYIRNSRNDRGLSADKIIQLRQEGVSDLVITTMLDQSNPRMPVSTQNDSSPQVAASKAMNVQTSPENIAQEQRCFYPNAEWYVTVKFPFGRPGDWRDPE
jgi:hypothetical protein